MYCRNQEQKRARKEAEKEEKQKAMAEKRAAIDNMLAGMTEEERAQWHQKNKVTTLAAFHFYLVGTLCS